MAHEPNGCGERREARVHLLRGQHEPVDDELARVGVGRLLLLAALVAQRLRRRPALLLEDERENGLVEVIAAQP